MQKRNVTATVKTDVEHVSCTLAVRHMDDVWAGNRLGVIDRSSSVSK